MSARPRGARYVNRELAAAVARALLANPEASANAIVRQTGGRRQDVLRIIRDARAASRRFPSRESGTSEGRP